MAADCPWQFHGVSRRENGDGTVTLTLEGWRYTTNAERDPGNVSECEWCHAPIRRDRFRTWLAEGGEACPDSGPGYWHRPQYLPEVVHAGIPCATVTVPGQRGEIGGKPVWYAESGTAADLVTGHVGYPYVPVWQGRGWTVEIQSGYPLWQTTS